MTATFKTGFCCSILWLLAGRGFAQPDSAKYKMPPNPEIYKIRYRTEVPVTVVAAGITLLNFSGISKKENSTEAQIENLDKDNIPFFDRWTVHVYSNSIDQASYIPLYIVNWSLLIRFSFGAIIGILIGSQIAEKISGDYLKKIFGWFVMAVSFYIVFKQFTFHTG